MSKTNKKNTSKRHITFVSAWDKKEKPINVVDDNAFSLYETDDEIGVAQTESSDVVVEKEQAAFLFGESSDVLFFRASFSSFVRIQADEKKDRRERLYNAKRACFCDFTDPLSSKTEQDIPVYHDSLSMIPMVIDDEDESENLHDCDYSSLSDVHDSSRREAEGIKNDARTIEQTMMINDEIQSAIDNEISMRGGHVYVRFNPPNNRLYPFDFVLLGNRFFVLVYANLQGDWIADEEMFNDEPPLWYSMDDVRVSPVFQAMKCRDFFRHGLSLNVRIESIVVFPQDCVIFNDEDVRKCWRKECHTVVVQTKHGKEHSFQTLHKYLASLSTDDIVPQALDEGEVNAISNAFVSNLEDWIK